MASLLDQLQEDLTAEALARPATKPKNEWRDPPPSQWTFSGYVARVTRYECPSCHRPTFLSQGIFSEETSPTGRRLTFAHQWPVEIKKRIEITNESHFGYICLDCLKQFNFS